MPFCKTCGGFHLTGERHRCPPMWRAWCPEYDGNDVDSASRVRAVDAEIAAERYAEEVDCGGTPVYANGGGGTVLVVPDDQPDAEPKKFTVSGEYTIVYSATEVTP